MAAIENEKVYALKIRESATDGSDFSNPDVDYRMFFLGEDGLVHVKDSSGVVTSPYSVSGITTTTPTFVAAGAAAHGTAGVTPAIYAGALANDIIVLAVQSDNETATAPAGYTQMGPAVGLGTAAAANATRLTLFWKRHTGTESDPTVTDTGDHTLAVTFGIRGCPTTGDPFVSVGQTRKITPSTTGTAAAGATTTDSCLIVNIFAHALDTTSAVFSGWTNASLTSVTEQVDTATTDGNGGGIGVATGVLASAGPFVGTTVTETSTVDVSSTFYFLPADAVNLSKASRVDVQVFTTPGFADTWTKPSGAKAITMTVIGGGASGSAGRNAATAAGGGGGGGGSYDQRTFAAAALPATLTVTAGAGGAATAATDGAASNAGNASIVTGAVRLSIANGGGAAGASATGSGGLGGNGGGIGTATAAGTNAYGIQPAGGGTGGTTAMAGASNFDSGGGAGAGGGTTQATSSGGNGYHGGAGGGGGGRSNTNVGTGGNGGSSSVTGGATAGAAGSDSPMSDFGGGGGAGGTSAAAAGPGGWPGGGGGGGGTGSGTQQGARGGDGAVTIITYF